eukprot:gnl/TRDRNA2_/TRDRNA2_85403_c1_seq1.p1 gnl/TRDRNA2_/TRDRNA2_85403_c1~~gnl/TRDRNA2_/TRDRNA2_85403_c1_seq1.p1  ORF type:complete len:625 (+),score=104.98 gnl/TRDRNA2_/TRDRNA2_85403_c1_seq1:1-1875(+)
MDSMNRIAEQRPVSLQEIGQQIRFFCAEELDVPGSGGVRDFGLGGPPTHAPPTTQNCQTFAKSLPRVSKALERGSADLTPRIFESDAAILDQRLAALMRMQVYTDDIQVIVLRLADRMSFLQGVRLEDYNAWPKSIIPVLVAHLIHGDEQPRWEKAMKLARKSALTAAVPRGETALLAALDGGPGISLALASALACQATISDHAWDEPRNEEELVTELEQEFKAAPPPGDRSVLMKLAVLGSYRPLLPVVEAWASLAGWRDAYRKQLRSFKADEWPFWQLWRLAVEEPLIEREFRASLAKAADPDAIGAPGVAGAGASKEVRAMYESNPYPKWSAMHPEMEWPKKLSDWLEGKNWRPPADWPSKSKSHPKVLVAGCGTGHWLTHFSRHYQGHAEVWAVDLSLSSLSFASRKAEENGIKNIHFTQGDILNLPEALKKEAPFDFIETGGVLHHLRDPQEGWKRLVELLRPGAPMLVALYSRIARHRGVEPCREFARKGSYNTTSEGAAALRRYRRDVLKLVDSGEQWAKDITSSRDFASLNGVRDLCLHVQETQYTLLEIEQMLKDLGLQWLQMAETLNEDKQQAFRKLHGIEPFSIDASLPRWHSHEEKYPTTFLGMYEFFVQKA